MSNSRQGFLDALAADHDDETTRLVYADWLDENDEPEAADQQRNWKASKEWLTEFGDRADIPYADVLQAGRDFVRSEGVEYYTQFGDDSARNEMYNDLTRAEFWRHWSVITGLVVSEERQGTVFSCSC